MERDFLRTNLESMHEKEKRLIQKNCELEKMVSDLMKEKKFINPKIVFSENNKININEEKNNNNSISEIIIKSFEDDDDERDITKYNIDNIFQNEAESE